MTVTVTVSKRPFGFKGPSLEFMRLNDPMTHLTQWWHTVHAKTILLCIIGFTKWFSPTRLRKSQRMERIERIERTASSFLEQKSCPAVYITESRRPSVGLHTGNFPQSHDLSLLSNSYYLCLLCLYMYKFQITPFIFHVCVLLWWIWICICTCITVTRSRSRGIYYSNVFSFLYRVVNDTSDHDLTTFDKKTSCFPTLCCF